MAVRLDADQIREVLDVRVILDAYALGGKLRSGWYRLGQCPRCGEKSSREAIAIQSSTGRWLHHGHERNAGGACSGDVYDFIAACEGTDTGRDFVRVKAIAAGLAGVSDTQPINDELVRQRRLQREAAELVEAAAREAAEESAAAAWPHLQRRHLAGEIYLANRGLDAHELIRLGAVRFTHDGDPCCALRSPAGHVTSIAVRHVQPSERKVTVRKGTGTHGTFIDAIGSIEHGRLVVIVEGLTDALTARLAWPDAVVLGANGAGNIAPAASAAIARIRLARAHLTFIPHHDKAGINAVAAAGQVALAAGLRLGRELQILGLPEPDLNAAYAKGWRP